MPQCTTSYFGASIPLTLTWLSTAAARFSTYVDKPRHSEQLPGVKDVKSADSWHDFQCTWTSPDTKNSSQAWVKYVKSADSRHDLECRKNLSKQAQTPKTIPTNTGVTEKSAYSTPDSWHDFQRTWTSPDTKSSSHAGTNAISKVRWLMARFSTYVNLPRNQEQIPGTKEAKSANSLNEFQYK